MRLVQRIRGEGELEAADAQPAPDVATFCQVTPTVQQRMTVCTPQDCVSAISA